MMKLYMYDYYDPVTETISNGQPEKVAHLFSDVPVVDYSEVNSISHIHEFGFPFARDYKVGRDAIKLLVELSGVSNVISTENDPSLLTPSSGDTYLIGDAPVGDWLGHGGFITTWDGAGWTYTKKEFYGFDFLSDEEKMIATQYKIGSNQQRLDTVSGDVDMLVDYGMDYHTYVGEARFKRLAYSVSAVHNHLEHIIISGYTLPEIILSEINPYNLIYLYREMGLGGIVDGDNSFGLMDYLNSTPNSPWAAGGLRYMPFQPRGLNNMGEFADKLLDILQKGKY